MAYESLKLRARRFALDIIRFVDSLPPDRVSNALGGQLLRAGTAVGANYHAACRARSPAEFIAKLGIVEEEADETAFWLHLLADAGKVTPGQIRVLADEASQLCAIVVASIRTARNTAHSARSRAASTGSRTPSGGTKAAGSPGADNAPHSALEPLRTPHSARRRSTPAASSTPSGGVEAAGLPTADNVPHSALRTPHSALE